MFCSKDIINQKVNKILINNLLTNLKARTFWSYLLKFERRTLRTKGINLGIKLRACFKGGKQNFYISVREAVLKVSIHCLTS